MKNNTYGFTLIELLIAIAIVGILATIALPSYQKYTRKAHYSEVVQAASPYKLGVEECFLITGDTKDCQPGKNGVPKNFADGREIVNKITVDKGIITVTPNNAKGIKASDNYILKPNKKNDQLTWEKSGGGIEAGYANR